MQKDDYLGQALTDATAAWQVRATKVRARADGTDEERERNRKSGLSENPETDPLARKLAEAMALALSRLIARRMCSAGLQLDEAREQAQELTASLAKMMRDGAVEAGREPNLTRFSAKNRAIDLIRSRIRTEWQRCS